MRRILMCIGGAVPALVVALVLIATSITPSAAGPVPTQEADQASGSDDELLGETSLEETPLESVSTLSTDADDPEFALERQDRDAFELVGVTWEQAEGTRDLQVQVQVRQDGEWSEWIDLEPGEAADGESDGVRGGTEPMWVGESDGVTARVLGGATAPDDLKVVTIDGGEDPAGDGAAEPASATAGDLTASTPAQPSVISRSSWGAGSGTTCDSPVYGKLRGVMIHHTAGSNSYAKSESASIVRSIQSYHVNGQGWCDIGYNLLVDKYGQIFEGRKGGWTRMVRGAHAGNFEINKSAVGIAMMGNYDSAHTATAQRNAVVRLVAWRLGSKDLPAKGTYKIGGHTVQRIAMHREVSATACPGRNGANWVKNPGGLRDRVENAIS